MSSARPSPGAARRTGRARTRASCRARRGAHPPRAARDADGRAPASDRGAPPPLGVDLELAPADLPVVAHARIEQGLVAPAERGRTGDGAQLSRGGGGNREANGADPLDLDVQILAAAPELRGERASGSTAASAAAISFNRPACKWCLLPRTAYHGPRRLGYPNGPFTSAMGLCTRDNGASGPRGFAGWHRRAIFFASMRICSTRRQCVRSNEKALSPRIAPRGPPRPVRARTRWPPSRTSREGASGGPPRGRRREPERVASRSVGRFDQLPGRRDQAAHQADRQISPHVQPRRRVAPRRTRGGSSHDRSNGTSRNSRRGSITLALTTTLAVTGC